MCDDLTVANPRCPPVYSGMGHAESLSCLPAAFALSKTRLEAAMARRRHMTRLLGPGRHSKTHYSIPPAVSCAHMHRRIVSVAVGAFWLRECVVRRSVGRRR